MAFKFPFTNYHELNLNWVLKELKELFEASEENVSTIETYDERLTVVETELPTVSATAQDAAQNAAAASTAAQQATATANTAQENATQAQSIAGFARQEAQVAQTAADAATQAAQHATATAQNFDGRITQAQNDASTALEASHSFENRVQAAITTANNAANTATNAQGIAMRADQNAALALDTLNAQRAELERIGAEQAALITAETEDKKTEIENLAESVLDSIPADYTELSALVDKKAPVIINSAAGSIASFDDGADNMKIQKLVVNIEPVQAGSGEPTPDNVRPISGWTGAEIQQTGKNLSSLDSDVTLGNGEPRSKLFTISTVSPGTYTMSWENTGSAVANCQVIMGGISVAIGNGVVFTADKPITKLHYFISQSDFDGGKQAIIHNIQLERGSIATAYEPYTDNQISVTFPSAAGTVYGGTLTLNPDRTGTLVVDRATNDLGTLSYSYMGTAGYMRFLCSSLKNVIKRQTNLNRPANAISSSYTCYSINSMELHVYGFAVYDDGDIMVRDARFTDVTSFKAGITGQTINYELASPQTIPLTAEQVSGILTSLYGVNNIWADTGSVSVDYPADTKLYIDGKLAELQATILENI